MLEKFITIVRKIEMYDFDKIWKKNFEQVEETQNLILKKLVNFCTKI